MRGWTDVYDGCRQRDRSREIDLGADHQELAADCAYIFVLFLNLLGAPFVLVARPKVVVCQVPQRRESSGILPILYWRQLGERDKTLPSSEKRVYGVCLKVEISPTLSFGRQIDYEIWERG